MPVSVNEPVGDLRQTHIQQQERHQSDMFTGARCVCHAAYCASEIQLPTKRMLRQIGLCLSKGACVQR